MSGDQADELARVRARVDELGRRVHAVEDLVVRAVALAGAVVLAAGLVLPIVQAAEGSFDEDAWLVTVALPEIDASADANDTGVGIALVVGFLGLAAVVTMSIVACLTAMGRDSGRVTLRVARWLAGLGVAGTLIAGLIVARIVDVESATMGPGYPALVVGFLMLLLLVSPRLAALWAPHAR